MREIIASVNSGESKIAPACNQILQGLMAEGNAKYRVFLPHEVAPHHCNRDGQMLTASGVEMRGLKFHKIGFVLRIFEEGAVCFADHPTKRKIAKSCVNLVNSDERFARYTFHDIVAGSVGATHSNHLVAAVKDERPCATSDIAVWGKYDKKLFYNNDDFKACGENGAKWLEIRHEVEEEFPELPGLLQSGLNAAQHVGQGLLRL